MSVLSVHDLEKSYGDTVILENISFEVNDGESIAFVSPSGSGKSTMLSMLGLLLSPTAGTIEVDNKDVANLADRELSYLRRHTFGFIFQHTQLVGSLRALENVETPANFAKGLSFNPHDRAKELLRSFGLSDRMDHYPFQLSIGQKRRVATARALLLDPHIIIADEPTNDLDSASAQTVIDALFAHVQTGGVLLFATHDPELADHADRVMHLQGKTFVE